MQQINNNFVIKPELEQIEKQICKYPLGITSDASYKLDGKVRYCQLKHPDGKFMNRMRENTSYEVNGIIGKSENPKSTVTIESAYGSVNLMP